MAGLEVLEGRNGAASRFQTCSGLKGNMNSIEEPATIGARIALTTPWMWCNGSRCRSRSSGVYFHASSSEDACAAIAD